MKYKTRELKIKAHSERNGLFKKWIPEYQKVVRVPLKNSYPNILMKEQLNKTKQRKDE